MARTNARMNVRQPKPVQYQQKVKHIAQNPNMESYIRLSCIHIIVSNQVASVLRTAKCNIKLKFLLFNIPIQ
jgi:hypothetical protein